MAETERPTSGTSRIIVKHLPKHLTQERLQAHFAGQKNASGEPILLTDCKLMRTQTGVSRRFAYIGYQNADDAQQAIDHFNRTYLDTSRILVEAAKSMGDPSLKRRGDRQAHLPNHPENNTKEKPTAQNGNKTTEKGEGDNDEDEAGFREFLEVMKPRHKAQTWANDAVNGGELATSIPKGAIPHDEEDDEYQTLPQMTNADDSDAVQETVLEEDKVVRDAPSGLPTEEPSAAPIAGQPSPPSDASMEEQIRESGRLFFRNLSYRITEQDVLDLLSPFGALTDFSLPMDPESLKPKGFAMALFMFPEHAVDAWRALDGTIVAGRLLHILPGRDTAKEQEQFEAGFRGAKVKKLKDDASKEKIWNSLFMNSNAVAKYIARTTGINKADLLTATGGDGDASAAVNLALAETHVIGETLNYLRQQGVDVDKLRAGVSGDVPRGKETLLIKGLPADYADLDLRAEVTPFGELTQFIIPPTRSIALVQYVRPEDAKSAFRGLAYKNFFGTPLKLEWAAADLFVSPTTTKEVADETGETAADAGPDNGDDKTAREDATLTLFIKNLSFSTSDTGLQAFLAPCPGVRAAKVTYRTDAKRPNVKLSTGFGFAEFDTLANAQAAMRSMQHKYLDGHAVQLDFAHGRAASRSSQKETAAAEEGNEDDDAAAQRIAEDDGEAKRGKPTKVIVRNVAFETKTAEIRALFANFGSLKSVRMPKKQDRGMGSEHRGFAFVDFGSHQEAVRAMRDMSGTHLYGRRLVMEFAKTDDLANPDVEAIRASTKRKYREEKAPTTRVSLGEAEDEEEEQQHLIHRLTGTSASKKDKKRR